PGADHADPSLLRQAAADVERDAAGPAPGDERHRRRVGGAPGVDHAGPHALYIGFGDARVAPLRNVLGPFGRFVSWVVPSCTATRLRCAAPARSSRWG